MGGAQEGHTRTQVRKEGNTCARVVAVVTVVMIAVTMAAAVVVIFVVVVVIVVERGRCRPA